MSSCGEARVWESWELGAGGGVARCPAPSIAWPICLRAKPGTKAEGMAYLIRRAPGNIARGVGVRISRI